MAIMLTDFIETETHLRNSAPGLAVWVFPDTRAVSFHMIIFSSILLTPTDGRQSRDIRAENTAPAEPCSYGRFISNTVVFSPKVLEWFITQP